jgi:hypothetical protein
VNGLSIFDVGDHVFGQPTRITAQTGMGRAGIINIEREADLSGKTHNKGVLILEGYLRSRYAQDKPLSISASICFEQSYTSVDGDSASRPRSTPSFQPAGVPIQQNRRHRPVNQRGEISRSAGNEKIEASTLLARPVGGRRPHPALSKIDLMRKDVVDAVRQSASTSIQCGRRRDRSDRACRKGRWRCERAPSTMVDTAGRAGREGLREWRGRGARGHEGGRDTGRANRPSFRTTSLRTARCAPG